MISSLSLADSILTKQSNSYYLRVLMRFLAVHKCRETMSATPGTLLQARICTEFEEAQHWIAEGQDQMTTPASVHGAD